MDSENKINILVVDSSKEFIDVLPNLIDQYEPQKYNVITATNGKEGVEQFKKHSPDLVLLEVNLPKLHGVNALKQMIKMNSKAKIFMASQESDQDIIDDCIAFGALKYYIKPFLIDTLLHDMHVALYNED